MTLRHRAPDALTAWPPAPLQDHRQVPPGFIDEHQADVRAFLLGRLQVFF
jgi:hypothetical protein